ncbi:uncharacterized conserved protein [Moorella thermoacetica Y72]|uniref:Uncharacterized conserved protein n=1 Tax=Moorella thermoacetica Y72 TaxID=1325331 RepID=A0A0S6UEH8_NEOTH|nr:DUF1284 domain-containing protein [Moorella thermoacetica]GAF25916.1 uncharacterized conserved protein [Moorella thermoacetica Y72]
MRIRAHHLLCALQFRGYGYSEAFVRRVSRLIALWRHRPGLILTITRSHDAWCRACPNRDTSNCRQAAARDARVLACLGLAPGARLEVAAAQDLVHRKIDSRAATYICTGCRWLDGGYCRW